MGRPPGSRWDDIIFRHVKNDHNTLLREFVRVLLEVDVISPVDDPHQGGVSKSVAQQPKTADISPTYKRKENTREKVQKVIATKVKAGSISSDDDLKRYIGDEKRVRTDGGFEDDEDISLALTALRAVPISVWDRLR